MRIHHWHRPLIRSLSSLGASRIACGERGGTGSASKRDECDSNLFLVCKSDSTWMDPLNSFEGFMVKATGPTEGCQKVKQKEGFVASISERMLKRPLSPATGLLE